MSAKLLTADDLARRYRCKRRTVLRKIIGGRGFPKAILPTGSPKLRVWDEKEVERWEATSARKAA